MDAVNGSAMYGCKIVPDATLLIIGYAVAAASVAPVSQIAKDVGQSIGIVLAALLFLAKFDYVKLSGLEPN